MTVTAGNGERRNSPCLVLAMGGGGDVIAASMLAMDLADRGYRPLVASLVWQRFVQDPMPGPRSPSELIGVEGVRQHLCRATVRTALANGGATNQAILIEELGLKESYVFDLYAGVQGVVEALKYLREKFGICHAIGVDVGGDIMATRPFESLRSPVCDAMLLAALVRVFPASSVCVFGLGVDGEIPVSILKRQIAKHLGRGEVKNQVIFPMATITRIAELLDARRLDTEATAIVVRSARGLSGNVMFRDISSVVRMDLSTCMGYVFESKFVMKSINPLSELVAQTRSLEQASEIAEKNGYHSELRHERTKYKSSQREYTRKGYSTIRKKTKQIVSGIADSRRRVKFVTERFLADRIRTSIGSIQDFVDDECYGSGAERIPPLVRLSDLRKALSK